MENCLKDGRESVYGLQTAENISLCFDAVAVFLGLFLCVLLLL
jgi:hypothetical protein